MTDELKEKTIELYEGITTTDSKSKEETKHTTVTFGKRLTGRDYFNLDSDPQGQIPTQYEWLIRRKMITKFGSIKLPVPLNQLLALDTIELEDLATASDDFIIETRGDRIQELRPDNVVKLRFGFEIEGTFYNVVKFGNRTTGRDEVDADALGKGAARECFLIGRQITQISTEDGAAAVEGKVDLSLFETLDGEDMIFLRSCAEIFRQSFRIGRKAIQKSSGGNSVLSGKGNGLEGGGHPESANGEN